MSKRHNTASQAISNLYSKEDCLLPPPGEYASEEYLNKLRQLCFQVIERTEIELQKVAKMKASKEEMESEEA